MSEYQESSIRYEERNSIQKSCINEFSVPNLLLSSSFASLSPYFQNSFATLTLSPHLNSLSHFWFTSAFGFFSFGIFSFFGFLVSFGLMVSKTVSKIRGFQNFGKILVSKSFALSHNQFFVDFLIPKCCLLKILILNLSSGQK